MNCHPPSRQREAASGAKSLLFRIGELLEIQLDPASVVLAVLRLHVLDDLGTQLARQVAPALAGVLLQLGADGTQVGQTAAGRSLVVRAVRLVWLARLAIVLLRL